MSQKTQGEEEGWPDWATDRLNRQYMLMANITISDGPFSYSVDQRQLQFQPNVVSNFVAPGQIIRPSTTPLTNHHSSRPPAADRSASELQAVQKASNGAQPSIPEDPTLQRIGIFSLAAECVDFIAKLDTGVDSCWINQKCLEELKIDPSPATLQTFKNFDGTLVESRKEVKIQWMFAKFRKPYMSTFRVAERRTPFSVILGRVFLLQEGLVSFKLEGNESLLPFVTQVLTEAEKKAISEKEVQVVAESKVITQQEAQKKALKKYLERQRRREAERGED